MTYNELWQRLTSIYDEGEAKAIVRMVLDVRFRMSMTDIICGKVTQLSEEDTLSLQKIINQLAQAEPVQYVLGTADFGGRPFHVEPGVLIPRPETEKLCRWITADHNLPYCGLQPPEPLRALDIGTGSGCIAVTLALDLWNAAVSAWDISADALLIARKNAHRLGAKVDFRLQDALHPEGNDEWDIIVSNPPYICEKEKEQMAKNVLDYEPQIALFVPDEDPLRFYRAIASYAIDTLRADGALYFEINPIYAAQMQEMLKDVGFRQTVIREDQFGKQRFTKSIKR